MSDHRRGRHSRPRHGWRLPRPNSWRSRVLLVVVAAALVLAVTRLWPSSGAPAAPGTPPTAAAVDRAVSLGQRYLDGLYKPLDDGTAVQSEDYGVPLRVHLPHYQRWVLLGEGEAGQCLGTGCTGATDLRAGPSSRTTESFTATFDTPSTSRAVRLDVVIDWAAGPGSFSVRVQGRDTDPATTAEVWLDRLQLMTVPSSGQTVSGSTTLPLQDPSLLRSLRYTVRHATQEAYLYWRARGDAGRADALASFLARNGYRPGVDIRAAIFGTSRGYPEDLPYVTSGPFDMYPDCDHLPAPGDLAYPYTSKVCLLGVPTYLAAAKSDPFSQAVQALTVLADHDDPDAEFTTGGSGVLRPAVTTPREVARSLERLFVDVGNGVPACRPDGCDTSRASALRTFHFGVLETVLGYRYHDPVSAGYADAAASAATTAQVLGDGLVHSPGTTAYRPAQIGAFPIYWDRQGRFVPTGGVVQEATDHLSMPPEYAGQVPSDTETTLDGWAFLVTYRCLAMHRSCSLTAWAA